MPYDDVQVTMIALFVFYLARILSEWLDSEESRKNPYCVEQSNANPDSSSRRTETGSCLSEPVQGEERNEAEISGITCTEKSVISCEDVERIVKGDICCDNQVDDLSGKGERQEEDEGYDDWVGIERSELEKNFARAVAFLSCKGNADQIDRNTRLQLYGLQRIVLAGACHGSQPMVLKVSARAKWNAWQKLGNMNRETAMEKFINILSTNIRKDEADKTFGENTPLCTETKNSK